MKRTHANAKTSDAAGAATSVSAPIYIVDACICYTGQGYDGCSCSRWLEVTQRDFDNKKQWTEVDVKRLAAAARR